MKKTHEMEKLERFLRSSQLVAGGFLGNDVRDLTEIIRADTEAVKLAGFSLAQVAARMQEITDSAKEGLGGYVEISKSVRACEDEVKGRIVCPWPHPVSFDKRITTVIAEELDEEISWSDLNIHMIAEHGFFEGRGSALRIEPGKLIRIIFYSSEQI